MIPERSGIAVDSTVKGEGVAMAIEESALAHIMSVLTDLYANPALAVIREYATNAADAHAEAGVKRPIEVSTPTQLRPMFTVRDFGAGLDAEDIRAIYSRYGASTKRESNAAVGMLGLGCKSALAYVDQFTLTGVKAGTRTVVSVSRDERGAGTMTIVSSEPTTDPSGVEVSVPVKRDGDFAGEAEDFFRHWSEGSVLLDGKAPEPWQGFELSDALMVVDRETGGYQRKAGPRLTVVMGNVAYPGDDLLAAQDINLDLPTRKGLIARVPIGAVQFAPSREALQDTAVTRRTIEGIRQALERESAAAIEARVAEAKTHGEAVKALVETTEALGLGHPEVKWQGQSVPSEIEAPKDARLWHMPGMRPGRYYRTQAEASRHNTVSILQAGAGVWLTEFENTTWTTGMRAKLTGYLEAHGASTDGRAEDVYAVEGATLPGGKWLGKVRTVAWPDVRKWRMPGIAKAAAGPGSTAGTYSVTMPDGTRDTTYPAGKIDTAKPILYTQAGTFGGYNAHKRLIEAGLSGFTVVSLPMNRVEKFKRLFPTARPYGEALREASLAWLDALAPADRETIAACKGASLGQYGVLNPADLLPDRVNDPDLARLAKRARRWGHLSAGWNQHSRNLSGADEERLGRAAPLTHEAITRRYPLLALMARGSLPKTGRGADDLYLYLNAAYAARQKEEGP